MRKDKIINQEDLELIAARFRGCLSLLRILYEVSSTSITPEEALMGLAELFAGVCQDFEKEIADAEDFVPAPEVAV